MEKRSRDLYSFALYDFGQSGFVAIIQTYLFAAYYVKTVAETPEIGASYWGYANSIAAFIVGVSAPFIGSYVDRTGYQKQWIALFTLLCILLTARLAFQPTLLIFSLAVIASEIAFIFYNSTLTYLAEEKRRGYWSGVGWALGYLGGLLSLVFALPLFHYYSVEACIIFASLWFLLFSLPFFLYVPERPLSCDYRPLSLTYYLKRPNLLLFFLSRLFYIDGLLTLFVYTAVFSVTVYSFNEWQVLLFGCSLHLFAGVGAYMFGSLDDRLGSQKVLSISLIFLMLCTVVGISVDNLYLYLLLTHIGALFVGPTQSSSRAWLAKMAPLGKENELFGLFALAGRATSFVGPLLVGVIAAITGTLRIGMAIVPLFFFIGWMLLKRIDE